MTSSFSKKSFIFWAIRNQFVAVNSGKNIDEKCEFYTHGLANIFKQAYT